jgi:hypothetical protein
MYNVVLSEGSGYTNSNSPPFYDFDNDVLYVGNDYGVLFAVQHVFNVSATNVPSVLWSTQVNTAHHALTGPVPDLGSANLDVLVGDADGNLWCVGGSNGTKGSGSCTASSISATNPIADAPIVDPVTERAYVFAGGNGVASTVVSRASTLSGSSTTVTDIGTNTSSGSQIHRGIFDYQYYATNTGNLWVCGKGNSFGTPGPVLYSIPITSGSMGAAANSGSLTLASTGTAGQCSPLSELYNPNEGGGTDWLFVGVPGTCAYGTSTSGCVMSFQIGNSSASLIPTTAFSAPAETNGTSGIIADNISNTAQASSMYFVTLGSPPPCTINVNSDASNCLVKVTQAGLQ